VSDRPLRFVHVGTGGWGCRWSDTFLPHLVRTGRAAHAQLEALHRLDVDALPDDLREIALLRLRHPTASTAELARRCKPGLSKAAAYRRLRRLQELSRL